MFRRMHGLTIRQDACPGWRPTRLGAQMPDSAVIGCYCLLTMTNSAFSSAQTIGCLEVSIQRLATH